MNYLPIVIDISKRPCLVIGGGQTALRKCRVLLNHGAQSIHLVAPDVCDELGALLATPAHQVVVRAYDEDVLAQQSLPVLVIAATNDATTNRRIHAHATARNIPVNVVDRPELCSFIFPSIVDRSPLTIAVSSATRAPLVSRYVRARLESLLPANTGKLATFYAERRELVKQKIADPLRRRHFWESVFDSNVTELLLNNADERATVVFNHLLETGHSANGEVYIVGAGPGDPDLLTFKALRLMQQADVVLYDRLVSPEILELVRKDAQRIYAGKQRSNHHLPQPDINEQLVSLARAGKKVLRLKGGDPFIFGRGGEEMEALAAAGIPFQIVPGITAASGCAAYAGIPLTHRDHAHSVRFLAGHPRDENQSLDICWTELTDSKQTLVFYMGLTGISAICAQLIIHSKRDPATPIAVIEKGTTPRQRIFVSTLSAMPALLQRENVAAPTLTIVGDVVRLYRA